MNPTLYLIRGIPGSGKSTLAKKLAYEEEMTYWEADMYFTCPYTGKYAFIPELLGRAHAWCYENVKGIMEMGFDVIVSNTFKKWKEMRPYVDLALKYQYNVKIIHCLGDFGSIHGLPEETMTRYRRDFIPNLDLQVPYTGSFISYEDYSPKAA